MFSLESGSLTLCCLFAFVSHQSRWLCNDVALRQRKVAMFISALLCLNGGWWWWMELLSGLPNANLDFLFEVQCSSKNDNWLSCANFLRLMFYASVLAACLLLSLILSIACCALPGMARRLEFPSSTSPVHYPEGCAAHSMALTRPWTACTGLCMIVCWMLCLTDPNLEWELQCWFPTKKSVFCQHVLAS